MATLEELYGFVLSIGLDPDVSGEIADGLKRKADGIEDEVFDQYYRALAAGISRDLDPVARKKAEDSFRDRARLQARNLTTRMIETELKKIGDVVARGLQEGKHPFAIARSLEVVKGLDSVREATFNNFSAAIDALNISASKKEDLKAKEFSRLLRSRKKTIAMTEARFATETARQVSAEARGAKWKVWITVGDNRVSEMDQENEAAGPIPIEKDFPSGHDRPPSHPNCRCSVAYASTPDQRDRMEERAKARAERTAAAIEAGKGTGGKGTAAVPIKVAIPKPRPRAIPKPPPKPKPEKRVFVPAKDHKEAKKRLEGIAKAGAADPIYSGKDRFGNPYLRYKVKQADLGSVKFSPENAKELTHLNAILDSFEEINDLADKIGIPKVRGIARGAGKGVANMGDGVLGLDKYFAALKFSQRLPSSTWFKGSSEKPPFTASYFFPPGPDRVRQTMLHEFAHQIHDYLGIKSAEDAVRLRPRLRAPASPFEKTIARAFQERKAAGTITFPSDYAKTDPFEWFAENYSLAKMGKADLADDWVVEMVEKIEAKSLSIDPDGVILED